MTQSGSRSVLRVSAKVLYRIALSALGTAGLKFSHDRDRCGALERAVDKTWTLGLKERQDHDLTILTVDFAPGAHAASAARR